MRTHHVIAAAVVGIVAACAVWLVLPSVEKTDQPVALGGELNTSGRGKWRQVEAQRIWRGQVPIDLRNEAPRSHFIADSAAWAKLWTTYRGQDPVPAVAFDRELVLVTAIEDPNWLQVSRILVDDQGDVKPNWCLTTLVAYSNPTTCSYLFALVKREEIRSVGGTPVPN